MNNEDSYNISFFCKLYFELNLDEISLEKLTVAFKLKHKQIYRIIIMQVPILF